MFIRLDNQGVVSIIEDGAVAYQAEPDIFALDASDVTPSLPSGFSMVVLETESGVCTGYDAKGNAFPGIEWSNASELHSRIATLKQAHITRITTLKSEHIKRVIPRELVPDTEDIDTKAEVTIL